VFAHFGSLSWIGSFHVVVTVGLVVAAAVTVYAIARAAMRLSLAIAGALLLVNAGYIVAKLAGVQLLPVALHDGRVGFVLCAMTALTVAGFVMRRVWARWLALALAAAGFGTGALNGWSFWSVTGSVPADPRHYDWFLDSCQLEWAYVISALGCVVIAVNVIAARGVFVASPTWTSREPVMSALRCSLIASFAAIPMLLVYAWSQPIAPATQPYAVALAAALAVAGVLAVRGRAIGAVALAIAGLGLAAQTAATFALADDRWIALYYVAFWTPAAIAAVVSGVLLARPLIRLLR
jgi:hypothetical protein